MVMCVCFYFSGWHCKLCWNTSLCMVGEWSVNCNWKHISTEQQPYSVLCDVRGKVTLCCNNYGQRWLTVNSWLFNNLQGVSMRIWINIAGLENPISILSNVWGGFSPLEESCFYVQLTCLSFQRIELCTESFCPLTWSTTGADSYFISFLCSCLSGMKKMWYSQAVWMVLYG